MGTSLPNDAGRSNLDQGTDDMAQARTDLNDLVIMVNALKDALGSVAQLQLGDGIETSSQPIGTPDNLQVKIKSGGGLQVDSQGLSIESGGGTTSFNIGDLKPSTRNADHGGTSSDLWKLCDGRAISRTTFSSLFSEIGTTYGAGDGSTTFNIPDLRGRFPLGANDSGLPAGRDTGLEIRNEGDEGGEEEHTLTASELPSSGGSTGSAGSFVRIRAAGAGHTWGAGDDSITTSAAIFASGGTAQTPNIVVDQHTHSTTGGSDVAHNTMPPYTVAGSWFIYTGVTS